MPIRARTALRVAFALFVVCACLPRTTIAALDPLRGLMRRIASTSEPDSAVVLVVQDSDLLEQFRAGLPRALSVIPFWPPGLRAGGAIEPAEMGRMYREASAATMKHTDVWVVSSAKSADSHASSRVDAFANMAARTARRRVLRGSIRTPRGSVAFSRWVDLPGGAAQRSEIWQSLLYADSVMAHGGPKLMAITRPFTRSELAFDADTLSCYVAHLADTSFYSIGGCSEVETVLWLASERLGQMGPGVVPVLVKRIADPNRFVRERVQDALFLATQDERILARTGGDYLKFYDPSASSTRDIIETWWKRFGHYWTPADSTQ